MSLSVGDSDLNTGLAGAIFTQCKVLTGARSVGPNSDMAKFCNALAQAIVTYITANATVPSTGLVAPNGGGPVTGATTVT